MTEKEGGPEISIFELQDKVAIVTGGAGGIGRCIALEYAKAGARVVVASRTQANLDAVAAEIKALGGESLAVSTDITVPKQVDNMVERTVDEFGRIDILVNNAGWPLSVKILNEISFEEWNETVALNLTGTFLCAVAAAKVMTRQNGGKIINVSSGSGRSGSHSVYMAHYGAAKAGVINLTESMAAEWAPYNISVNCIVPGVIATEKNKSFGGLITNPEETAPDGTPVSPLLLLPNPEDVAHLALFLASPAADHISGEIIPIRSMRTMER